MQRVKLPIRPLAAAATSLLLLASCANARGSSAGELGSTTTTSTTLVQMATPSVPLLPGGEASDLNEAAKALSFSVLVPDGGPATSESLTNVWLDQLQNTVALEYSDGDISIVESPATYDDPIAFFKHHIKEDEGLAVEWLTTVQGYPALAIQGKSDAFSSNASWLTIDIDGVEVDIAGTVYPVETLIQIGASLNVAPSGH